MGCVRIPGLRFEPDTELPWRETRLLGVSWLPLHVEEGPRREGRERGGGAVLIRMEPGCGYAPHRHLGSEDVLVLQGGYRDEHGEYRSGEHVHYVGGSVHAPRALGDPDRPSDATNNDIEMLAAVFANDSNSKYLRRLAQAQLLVVLIREVRNS